ncbi:MAG: hypothetical protein HGB05_13935, partial [Chloroflexi bacterium]|nr:hypothetical protein [Chloroflexota bacterium]
MKEVFRDQGAFLAKTPDSNRAAARARLPGCGVKGICRDIHILLQSVLAQGYDPVALGMDARGIVNVSTLVYSLWMALICTLISLLLGYPAALIMAEEETAMAISRNSGKPVVWITGVGEANEHSFAGKNHKVMARIMSDCYAAQRAYGMAGIKDPKKSIQVIELHDAFVHQLEITMAEFGFVPLGRADSLVEDGLMTPGGQYLVNPCGGLIFCGHAVGAINSLRADHADMMLL